MLKPEISKRIAFGGGKLSVMPTLGAALTILEKAFENGIVHFDTAPSYGSGYSEKIIGRFARNKRGQVVIATKFGLNPAKQYSMPPIVALPLNYLKRKVKNQPGQKAAYNPGRVGYRLVTRRDVEESFQNSLVNLQTDYFDYYLLHEALPAFLEPEAKAYLLYLKSSGQIKKLGLAASSVNYLEIPDGELEDWDVLQYEYSPLGTSEKVREKFPGKESIVHSLLVNAEKPKDIFPEENRAGYVLANYLKKGLADKVLFSTSRMETLLTNISSINLYS